MASTDQPINIARSAIHHRWKSGELAELGHGILTVGGVTLPFTLDNTGAMTLPIGVNLAPMVHAEVGARAQRTRLLYSCNRKSNVVGENERACPSLS
jgi:hypothetical protein